MAGPAASTRIQREQGANYPAWVLDRMGVEVMLANRVSMGKSIAAPALSLGSVRRRTDLSARQLSLARQNSDRKSFFALEDQLRQRYLKDAGMDKPPATLAEYLTRVVTPTLERQRQGGAVAEKFEAAYLRSLAFDKVDRADAERIYAALRRQARPHAGRVQALAGFPVPLYRRRMRPPGNGRPSPHHGRRRELLRRGRRQSSATWNRC